jgi:hypothetical protein
VTANFWIEQDPKRGERGVRETTGAPKKLTYARKARIVDGDDGLTYIAELTAFGHISIMKGDMKFQHETLFERDPGYSAALALFVDVCGKDGRPRDEICRVVCADNCPFDRATVAA